MRFDRVLPRPFRQAQSPVRFTNKLLPAFPGPKRRHADADRDADRIVTETVVNPTANALGHLRGRVERCAGHEDRELFSPVARTHVEDSHAAAQQFRNRPQGAVSFDVAERVVDALEIIDVRHQQRQRLLLTMDALDFAVEARFEVAPIEEPGDGINGRHPLQLVEALLNVFARQRQGGWCGEDSCLREIACVEGLSVFAIGEGDHACGTKRTSQGYLQVGSRAVSEPTPGLGLSQIGLPRCVRASENSFARGDAQVFNEDGWVAVRCRNRKRLVIVLVNREGANPRPNVTGNRAQDEGMDARAVGFATEPARERVDA